MQALQKKVVCDFAKRCERFLIFLKWKLFLSFISSHGSHVTAYSYINRGSYMSAHNLLNLLNKLGKSSKMLGLSSILSLICNEFNTFNNTGTIMLDSIYHRTKILKIAFLT